MPRTPEQYEEIRKEKKQMIMNAALELFANEGYHATSISKIAEKANISKGLMYNYFSSKDELLTKIIQTFSEEVTEMMNPDHDEEITLEEAIQYIDLYFEMITTRTEQIKLYYQLTMQPIVLETIVNLASDDEAFKTNKLFIEFLSNNNNKRPVETMLTLNAVMKGFGIQYTSAPEMFNAELILKFKNYIKDIFIFNKNQS